MEFDNEVDAKSGLGQPRLKKLRKNCFRRPHMVTFGGLLVSRIWGSDLICQVNCRSSGKSTNQLSDNQFTNQPINRIIKQVIYQQTDSDSENIWNALKTSYNTNETHRTTLAQITNRLLRGRRQRRQPLDIHM